MSFAKSVPTGLSNEVYDLVLVLQQAASDVVRYTAFAEDARLAGDEELAEWFGELAASDRVITRRASEFLDGRLSVPSE